MRPSLGAAGPSWPASNSSHTIVARDSVHPPEYPARKPPNARQIHITLIKQSWNGGKKTIPGPPRSPERSAVVLDAIVISDVHLGSENCQAKALTHFLEEILAGNRPTARLILNGDVFDSIDFRRLKKNHWKVLSLLRKLSDKIEIIWLVGNHDGTAEIVSHLLGVRVEDEYVLASGGRRILVLHGHIFDEFIDNHPFLTWVGDVVYALLQKIDSSHAIARFAKHRSKAFLRNEQKIQARSLEHARKLGCDAVCCGHTHH